MVAWNTGGLLKQAECRCLWCVKWDVERSGASRWRDGAITSSLPTRQPRVVLLCWIECNRPRFFSLTTGACELTSSLPWERNCHSKANALASFFPPFTVPFCSSSVSLSHPVLISVLFVLPPCLALSFSRSLIVCNTWLHYFPSFKMVRKASWWCAVKACCQNLGTISTVQGDPNWKPGALEVQQRNREWVN